MSCLVTPPEALFVCRSTSFFFNEHTALPLSFNSTQFAPDAESDTVAVDNIPEDWMGLDVGPKTISNFEKALAPCKTIVRNLENPRNQSMDSIRARHKGTERSQ